MLSVFGFFGKGAEWWVVVVWVEWRGKEAVCFFSEREKKKIYLKVKKKKNTWVEVGPHEAGASLTQTHVAQSKRGSDHP